jgi:phosphoribosyl-ATP pyrophosphohydrolase/phosphoribosyl-AMP cyclohydrolase
MIVASIDIQDGSVVQLKQGSELVLRRDNAGELAETFNRYGEVAVIDLDAALGKGNNFEMIKPLLRKAECRVGGGVRTPEQANELVRLGAAKIIVGSQAFRDSSKRGAGVTGGEFAVNTGFLESMAEKIGRERLVVAVDARSAGQGAPYEVTVDGWKTRTGLPLIESAKAIEPFTGALLFTCVDREGTMTGMDMAAVQALRQAVSCRITVAGGVSSLEEIAALSENGCDVQLGMALYTGKIALADAFISSLNWKKLAVHSSALIPVIAQNIDGQVMMTGFAGKEALSETFRRGNLCFHSRSRNRLWMKGENSGNTLRLISLRTDCDRDALLATIENTGPVCHTGDWSCFGVNRRYTWQYLQSIIMERFRNPVPGSYTATLDSELVREKVMEEAGELCAAKTHEEVIWEAADLLYFVTALMTREGVSVAEVLNELDRRRKK